MSTPRTAVTATKRFGLGAKPGELASVSADPRSAVLSQLDRAESLVIKDDLPTSAEALTEQMEFLILKRQEKKRRANEADPDEAPAGEGAAASLKRPRTLPAETTARLSLALSTDAPYLERLVAFWANHFSVSTKKNGYLQNVAGAYEREAIRPHVLGRFRDMLQAVAHHPAMIMYLDNDRSIGPRSKAGRRRNKRGLNENLAREILELHTVGVDGGYSQDDVTNFARALTGWGINRLNTADPGTFAFLPERHEPGRFTIMGRRYAQSGIQQAEAVLDDLAAHPATAAHVARKLAVHFVGESAPASLIDALTRVFRDTEGDLAALARALAGADEAWSAPPAKLLPPYDFIVSTFRGLQFMPETRFVSNSLKIFGQPLWGPDSPAGWPDGDDAWAAPAALLERVDWADQVARKAPPQVLREVDNLVRELLGDAASKYTVESVARAESRRQALVMLLMSPEFQRR